MFIEVSEIKKNIPTSTYDEAGEEEEEEEAAAEQDALPSPLQTIIQNRPSASGAGKLISILNSRKRRDQKSISCRP